MKKIVLLIIAGIVLLALVATCGNEKTSDPEKDNNNVTSVYSESDNESSSLTDIKETEEVSKIENTRLETQTSSQVLEESNINDEKSLAATSSTKQNDKKIETNNDSQTVYITATGKKYHSRKGCAGLSNANAIYETTLSEAENSGLEPCKKCY